MGDLQEAYPDRITTVRLMRNFGQHNALMCGFRLARGRCVLTMDDDLQHPPEAIPKLLKALADTGVDVVYGVPEDHRHRRWRSLGSVVATAFYRLVFKTRIQPTSLRIARREVIDAILSYSLNYTYIDGLLAWNTQHISEVTVDHSPRAVGRSGYSLTKLLVLALNLLTNFSLLPLQVVSGLGLLSALGGLVTAVYFLIQYMLSNIGVPGYASIIVAIMVLGGIQLLSLGVMGEYLGRLHLNMNRKPQYTVREARKAKLYASADLIPGKTSDTVGREAAIPFPP